MLSWLLPLLFISKDGANATTLDILQREGNAIYDMSQAMTSLVTQEGMRSRKYFYSIA